MTQQELADSEAIERSVVKKLMWGLVPFLALLYMFNILDRTNISIAALTMRQDLHFSNAVYGFGGGVFFIGYFLLEIPSNLIMERVGARRWIARIMISWGIISACMGLVRSAETFYGLRFLLGLAEAGFYPGILLYLTYWVPGSVRTRVIARFLALTAIISLPSSPIGGQLLRLDGFHGLRGWQWLFLAEGLPSVLLGFLVLKVLPNGPGDAPWISAREREWIDANLKRENENVLRVHLPTFQALTDPRVLHLCAIFLITAIGGQAVGLFVPQLLKARSGGTWSNTAVTNYMMIPGVVGAIAMVIAAIYSDRSGQRRWHVAVGYFVAGLAYLACAAAPTAQWMLIALCLNTLGERCAAGSYWAVTTNLMGARAAASGLAFINSVGNLGGFIGPWIMGVLVDKSHGNYTTGLYMAAALMVCGAALSYLLRRHPAAAPSPVGVVSESQAAEAIAARPGRGVS